MTHAEMLEALREIRQERITLRKVDRLLDVMIGEIEGYMEGEAGHADDPELP